MEYHHSPILQDLTIKSDIRQQKNFVPLCKNKRKAYIQLKTLYNSASEEGVRQVMKEAIERIEISKYMEEDNSFNYFMSENLLDAEATKSRYQNWENFILSYSLTKSF